MQLSVTTKVISNSHLSRLETTALPHENVVASPAKAASKSATVDKFKADLARTQEESATLKSKIAGLENELKAAKKDCENFKDELELKAAQIESNAEYVNSLQNRSNEMEVQKREADEQLESTQQELAETERQLMDRTQETDTMRKMLRESGDRTDARIKEIKDRLTKALEERDKAEEETATVTRRKTRETMELKERLHAAERGQKRAEEARELVDKEIIRLRETKQRLETEIAQTRHDLEERKKAMVTLSSTLDSTDGQFRENERQKTEYRNRVEQAELKNSQLQTQIKVFQPFCQHDELRPSNMFDTGFAKRAPSSFKRLCSQELCANCYAASRKRPDGLPQERTAAVH